MTIREKVILEGEDRASQAFKKAGGGFEAMGETFKKVAVAGGLYIAGRKLLEVGGYALKMAIDAGEAAAAFDTTFGAAVGQASEFVDEFANKAGFATGELQQLMAVTGNVVQGIGATEEESANLAESMARLAGDVASFSNAAGGAPAVLLALQSAINGEREALKTYGLAIAETEVQERALQQTQKERAEDLTRLEKAQATVDLAYEKAGKAIGDLDRTQDSAANTLRRIQARGKEAATTLGEELLPYVEDLLPALENIIPVAGQAGSAMADAFGAATPAIAGVLSGLDEIVLGMELAANSVVNVWAGGVSTALSLIPGLNLVTGGLQDQLTTMAESAAASNDLAKAIYDTRNAMREGRGGTAAYGDALVFLYNQGTLTADGIQELLDVTGLAGREQANALTMVREYGEAHGWAASQLALLEEAEANAAMAAIAAGGAQRDAARHGRETGDAAAETAEDLGTVTEAEEEAAKAAADLRKANKEAADSFRADLRDAAIDFLDGFEKAPEQIKTTLDQFEENFTSRQETLAGFWTNLKTLADAGLTDLAEEIRAQGPEAAGFLEKTVADMEEAAKLDELIGNAERDMGQLTGAYAGALEMDSRRLYGDLETFGGNLVESIITGAEGVDLRGALGGIVTRAVDGITGTGAGSSGGGRRGGGGNFAFQAGTWSVPGGAGEAIAATVHGTEIIIPPEGSGGRAEFAHQLAAELARAIPQTETGGRPSVIIENLQVIVPEATPVHEAVAAGTAEAAIESLLS